MGVVLDALARSPETVIVLAKSPLLLVGQTPFRSKMGGATAPPISASCGLEAQFTAEVALFQTILHV